VVTDIKSLNRNSVNRIKNVDNGILIQLLSFWTLSGDRD
jgi:hypothetical protein